MRFVRWGEAPGVCMSIFFIERVGGGGGGKKTVRLNGFFFSLNKRKNVLY